MKEHAVSLNNGRIMQVAEYGLEGDTLVFCHGTPGSRYNLLALESSCLQAGIRALVPDRPGYGASTPNPEGSLLDWADELSQMLDALAIKDCYVVGQSGGGPFALASAYRHPKRIKGVGLLAGMGEWLATRELLPETTRQLWEFARDQPLECAEQLRQLAPDAQALLALVENSFGVHEKKVFNKEPFRSAFNNDFHAMCQQNHQGFLYDMRIQASPWGFDLSQIETTVTAWHATADGLAPPSVSTWLTGQLSNCQLQLVEEHGHFFWLENWPHIVDELTN